MFYTPVYDNAKESDVDTTCRIVPRLTIDGRRGPFISVKAPPTYQVPRKERHTSSILAKSDSEDLEKCGPREGRNSRLAGSGNGHGCGAGSVKRRGCDDVSGPFTLFLRRGGADRVSPGTRRGRGHVDVVA